MSAVQKGVRDVIIVGAGPAGLAAGLYIRRAKLEMLILEKETPGGQIMNVDWVENYPGFPEGVSGAVLGSQMLKQAIMMYNSQLELTEVEEIKLQDNYKVVKTARGDYLAKVVIIAGGAQPKKLGVPGEDKYVGKGVIYCAFCDGNQFANQTVAVAGGGDAGLTEAIYLTRIASRVIVVELEPQLTASTILKEKTLANSKIEIRCGSKILAIKGDDQVKALEVYDMVKAKNVALKVDGILVRIGLSPNTAYLEGLLTLDREGFVVVNDEMETSSLGIFAAGDIRHGAAKQISTAVGDGAAAALSAVRSINKAKEV